MSTRESVTCPQCGSLVPVGDRKCDNCGARQKDFAPAPKSYTRPEPAPVVARAPAPAPAPGTSAPAAAAAAPTAGRSAAPPTAPPIATSIAPPDDYRPLAHRAPGSTAPGAGSPRNAAPTAPYAVRPSAAQPSAVQPYAAGSHAEGVPTRASAGAVSHASRSTSSTAAATAPGRSVWARRALIVALIPVGVNLLGFVALAIIGGLPGDTLDLGMERFFVVGFILVVLLLLAGLANLVLFVLALVFGILGVRETAGGAATGRARAVVAFVIVAWHLLLAVWVVSVLVS